MTKIKHKRNRRATKAVASVVRVVRKRWRQLNKWVKVLRFKIIQGKRGRRGRQVKGPRIRIFGVSWRLRLAWPQTTKAKVIWGVTGVVIGGLMVYLLRDLPSPTKLTSQAYPVSTLIYDRNGELLYEIFADQNRTPVKLTDLPGYVPEAAIAIEDQNFYRHFGFSLQGIIRALRNTLLKNKLQGGSTITQQLVKTALLTPERTLSRKIKEALLTLAVEILYSKKEILEMYLNHIPYGGTAYGIEAAAQRFFGKKAAELTLPEAALLAGLPQAPTRYSPFTNPEEAKARQGEVLRRMKEDNYLTQEQASQAFEEKLSFAPVETNIRAPHFVFYVKSLLEEKYGLQTVERGGLRVKTTLDLTLQDYAQASVAAELTKLARYRVSNGAALVTKPETGEILAMIGSKDFFDNEIDGKVNLTTRLRQPGSAIKPINYVTAFQTGRLTPSSLLLDIPTCFLVSNQKPYCPRNYDGSFHGPVQVMFALANSYNMPAVKTLAVNGLESMIATASAMGITSFTEPDRYGLALTLGGGEVTMLDMAAAFGTLANQGVPVKMTSILKVEDYTGKVYEENHPERTAEALKFFFEEENKEANVLGVKHEGLTRVLNREPAFLIAHILLDNNARAAAFGANSELVIAGKTVSVKTGTTNDLRDNWTIGFTHQFLTTSWVGNNDNTPMNPAVVSGVTGAAPIWHDIMAFVLRNEENTSPRQPEGIVGRSVCSLGGGVPKDGEGCETRFEYFWEKYLPATLAPVKQGVWVFKDSGLPITTDNEPAATLPPADTIEAREHLTLADPFTQTFCLDCPWPEQTDEKGQATGRRSYPTVNIRVANPFLPYRSSGL